MERKDRTSDKKRQPFGLRVDFEEDKIVFTEENPEDAGQRCWNTYLLETNWWRIIKDGKGRSWTVKDLADEHRSSSTSDSIRTTLTPWKAIHQTGR